MGRLKTRRPSHSRLAELDRHPDLEALYAGTFNPLLKRHYGTTEAYLRRQLGWPAQEATDEKQDREQFWTRGATTNVRRNDWPYAIPKDVQSVPVASISLVRGSS